jgi:hypothetical protein
MLAGEAAALGDSPQIRASAPQGRASKPLIRAIRLVMP